MYFKKQKCNQFITTSGVGLAARAYGGLLLASGVVGGVRRDVKVNRPSLAFIEIWQDRFVVVVFSIGGFGVWYFGELALLGYWVKKC